MASIFTRVLDLAATIGKLALSKLDYTGITSGNIPKYNGTSLANSQISEASSKVGVGVTTPDTALHVKVAAASVITWERTGVGKFLLGVTLDDSKDVGYVGYAGQTVLTFNEKNNIGVGGATAFGTNSNGVLAFKNASGVPSGDVANQAVLYASGGELIARDSSGNVTTISPHSEKGPAWIYDRPPGIERVIVSMNKYAGEIEWSNESRRGRLSNMTPAQILALTPLRKKWFEVETFAEYNTRQNLSRGDEGYLQKDNWEASRARPNWLPESASSEPGGRR